MFRPEIKENNIIKDHYEIEVLFKRRMHYNKFQYFIK